MTDNETKRGFFSRLKKGLARTQLAVTRRIDELTLGKREIDAEMLDKLEELLITSDLGVMTVQRLMDTIRFKVKRNELSDPDKLHLSLKNEIQKILCAREKHLSFVSDKKPFVVLTVGVNGTGKTTTIGKIARIVQAKNKSVMLAAADTFRAAAIDQLEIWGERVGCRVVKHKHGADPSAVAFDALQSALSHGTDVLIIDTAGRLHTKAPLMDELKKIRRTISKKLPDAPHETLLVLDATTGQNAINQAKMFSEALTITGIVLTKLDGTAKGGVIVGIAEKMNIPVRYIGVGEKTDDLRPFIANDFVDALFDQ